MKTTEAKKRVDEVARRHADAQVALTNARHALEQAQADLAAARAAEALDGAKPDPKARQAAQDAAENVARLEAALQRLERERAQAEADLAVAEKAEAQEFCDALSKTAEDAYVSAVKGLTQLWAAQARLVESQDYIRYDRIQAKHGIRAKRHGALRGVLASWRNVHGVLSALEMADPTLYKEAGGIGHLEREQWLIELDKRPIPRE